MSPLTPLKSDVRLLARLKWCGAIALLLISAIYLFAPLRNAFRGANDFAWVYMAGRTWLKGASPYDFAKWKMEWAVIVPSPWTNGHPPPGPYVYPPHWGLLAIPMALLPWPLAARIWDLIDVVSFIGVCGLTWKLALRREPTLSRPLLLTLIACAGFNGAVRWCLIEAQMSILPLCALVAAFWACRENRQGWLAVFAFIATLKPQVSFLPLTFIFLSGGRVGILRAAVAVALVSLLVMAPSGLSQLPEQLRNVYQLHLSQEFNASQEFFGVSALLGAFTTGFLPLLLGPLLGLLGVFALAHVSHHASHDDQLSDPLWRVGLLSALEVAFIPQHGYDLVMYTPVVVMSALFRPRWLTVLVCLLIGLASRTKGLEERLHVHPLAPFVCLSIAAICLIAVRRHRVAPAPALAGAASK